MALPSAKGVRIATAGLAKMKFGRVREAMWEVIFVFVDRWLSNDRAVGTVKRGNENQLLVIPFVIVPRIL